MITEVSNYIDKSLKDQPIRCGNRIGHNPKIPKMFVAPENHRRPETLKDIIQRFTQSYFNPRNHKDLYHHKDIGGKDLRLIRSEFREMISMGCSIITHYYDVLTGELGFRNERGIFIRFSYESLAQRLGVSLARVKKFFGFLKKRNFLTIKEDRKKDANGQWTSNISRKIIKSSFFVQTLGIGAWKKIQKYRKWLDKTVKPNTDQQKENRMLIKEMLAESFKTKDPSKQSYRNPDKDKQLVSRALELYEEDSSKSLSDYLRELRAKHA